MVSGAGGSSDSHGESISGTHTHTHGPASSHPHTCPVHLTNFLCPNQSESVSSLNTTQHNTIVLLPREIRNSRRLSSLLASPANPIVPATRVCVRDLAQGTCACSCLEGLLMNSVAISDDNVNGWIRLVSTGDGK